MPDIDWLVNSSAINIGPDVSVTSNATHSMLTVESVADTNDGTYTCNVINSVGSDQASIIVNILLSTLCSANILSLCYTVGPTC